VSFADPLKEMLRAIGLTDEHLFGSLKGEPLRRLCGVTPRRAMQTLGTEWGRMLIHKELWTQLWWETARPILAQLEGKVVTDDLRYPNEAGAVRERGGGIWRIYRPGTASEEHTSEALIDSIRPDRYIDNDGPVESLDSIVNAIISSSTDPQSAAGDARTT